MKGFDEYIKAYDQINTPLDITKLKEELKTNQVVTTQTNKGVETMKKNVYKRADGRWQYAKQQNGLQYYAIANTYRELLEKIKDIKPKQIKNIKYKTKKTTQNSFIQYYQMYIDTYIKPKPITQEVKNDWQRQLTNDITPKFKYVKMEDVTAQQIQVFLNGITQEVKRDKIYQRITRVIKHAYATGKIKRDVTLAIEKPKRQTVQERNPLIFHEQIQLLKAVKKSKIYTFVVFSLVVGSRREETMQFDISTDLDERKKQIHIKGTKTKNADRYVAVTSEFIEFLKANMKKNRFDFKESYPTHELGRIFKALKIDACLHSLRHTCSANMYFLGAKDKYRQMQLGHASIVTTNNIYTNIKENIRPRALRLIYGGLYPKFD